MTAKSNKSLSNQDKKPNSNRTIFRNNFGNVTTKAQPKRPDTNNSNSNNTILNKKPTMSIKQGLSKMSKPVIATDEETLQTPSNKQEPISKKLSTMGVKKPSNQPVHPPKTSTNKTTDTPKTSMPSFSERLKSTKNQQTATIEKKMTFNERKSVMVQPSDQKV